MAGNGKNGAVKTVKGSETFETPKGATVKVAVDGRKMTLEFELAKVPPPSSTGKSLLHFSSGGFFPIVNGYKLSLVVIGKVG